MFAGQARIAKVARAKGLQAAALDFSYGNEFDVNSSAGFVCLKLQLPAFSCLNTYQALGVYTTLSCKPSVSCQSLVHSNGSTPGLTCKQLRLLLKAVLDGAYGSVFSSYGVCCSTYVCSSRGSTKRSILTPMGCLEYPSVKAANLLTSRTVFNVEKTVGTLD